MSPKEMLLRVVRAFMTLVNIESDDAKALAAAQADVKDLMQQLSDAKAENALSPTEQAEVQAALDTISAAEPPSESDVDEVAEKVNEESTTGGAGVSGDTGS